MLRVVTREEPPYVMRCDNCSSTSQLLHNHSSQGYQGFAIDLLDAISQVSTQSQLLDSVLELETNVKRRFAKVSIVSYSRPSLMVIASASQFHVFLPWGQFPFSI